MEIHRVSRFSTIGRLFQKFQKRGCPLRDEWKRVYVALGMRAEFRHYGGSLSIVPRDDVWAVPVIQGVTIDRIMTALLRRGVIICTYVDDFEAAHMNDDRDSKSDSYVVHFRKTNVADTELAGLSADDLRTGGIRGITLIERLLLEAWCCIVRDDRLDADGSETLCAGSRISHGRVPYVCRDAKYDRELYICGAHPGYKDARLRARAVI